MLLNEEQKPLITKGRLPISQSIKTNISDMRKYPRYGDIQEQKHIWAVVDQRTFRLRIVTILQTILLFSTCCNYLWWTQSFGCFVGLIGLIAVYTERMAWVLIYLLVCLLEFARIILLGKQVFYHLVLPEILLTHYEMYQVAVIGIEEILLIPLAFYIVLRARYDLSVRTNR